MAVDRSDVAVSCYQKATLRGISNGIRRENGVRISFDIEGGPVLRVQMAPDQFHRFSEICALVALGLPQDEFVERMNEIHATQYSQSSESDDAPSVAGFPQEGQSV